MAQINRLTVIHTTADEDEAGSDSSFQLEVSRTGFEVLERPFPNLPHDDRERGRTDQYPFNLGQNVDSAAAGFRVRMRILGDDGWLPSSIFVIGHGPNGENVLLGSHRRWNKGAFDKGPDAGGPSSHVISGSS